MSRSVRKPYLKDNKPKDNYYNKCFRRRNKQRVTCEQEPLLMRELVCDYDICDWSWYCPEDKSAYRK